MNTRAWAHAIVRRYPLAWRERYEAEVGGLIDDTRVQFRDLGELLRGLFTERARELLTSVENPRRTATILAFIAPVAGGAFILLSWFAGLGLQAATGPWSDATQYFALFLFLALGVASFVIWYQGWKRRDRSFPAAPSIPPAFVLVLLPMLFVEVALFGAIPADEPTYRQLIPIRLQQMWTLLMVSGLAGNLLASLFPGHALLQAFAKVSYAESQVRANEKWVEGCRDMIAKGVPSPLGEALALVERWMAARDSARKQLRELGYEARFRGRTPLDAMRETTP